MPAFRLKGDWCFPSTTRETDELLRQCLAPPAPAAAATSGADLLQEVAARSRQFPVPFPVETVRLHKLKETHSEAELTRNIVSTYPLMHERVLLLMASFIMYKREFGSQIEKTLYKDMSILDLVDRILLKRAVTFCGPADTYKLLSGEEGHNGWEAVGTPQQRPPLVLDTCLSYDEMRLAAMLFVGGRTAFVNSGARHNAGLVETDGVEADGVILGLIGTRLERKGRMEYEELLITEQQNTLEGGYGEEVTPRSCLDVLRASYVRNDVSGRLMWRQMWSEFYQVPSYTYEEVSRLMQQPGERKQYAERFVPRPRTTDIFDNEVYYKRLSIPFDCALLEANARAAEDGRMAYLNIVGIGLGVWMVSPHQADVFVLALLERARALLARGALHHLADVNFAFVRPGDEVAEMLQNYPLIESSIHPNGGIRVHQVNREPSSQLTGEHAGQLLVTTYAWDGNAHPGNEFWLGSLTSSGDPAAACSTQVAELHNAHINTRHVRAGNLRVAGAHGLLPLDQYCRLLLGDR